MIVRKNIEGGRRIRGSFRKLCFSEQQRSKVWKYYMEMIGIIMLKVIHMNLQ